jgi:hypothetical protein
MTWRGHAIEILQTPALLLWCLFIVLAPIYVFKSGLPQPGDLLVLLLLPFALMRWDGRLDAQTTRTLRPLFLFTVWVTVVSLGWAAILGRWSPKEFLTFPLFYFFNVGVFLAASVMGRRNPERFLRITVGFVIVTIIYQVLASFFYTNEDRGTLFFNNPNQLGYYALLSACLVAMTQRHLGTSKLVSGLAVSGCAYLAVLSASRAAVAGIFALLAVMLFSNPRTIILACIAAIALLTIGGPISDAIERAEARATEQRDTSGSFAQERGYDRLWNNPQYLAFGAGEGAIDRFAKPGHKAKEMHSSIGALLFGYGIVGVALFVWFAVRLVRGGALRVTLMLLPVLIFAFAHNGLRSTPFWVLLAAFCILKRVSTSDATQRKAT